MIFYLLAIIIGACLGSFLNVLITRTARGEDWISKPSHCEKCQTKLKWYDNLPIISFLILRGKCRRCRAKIDPWHFIMEILGALTVLGWWQFRANFIFSDTLLINHVLLNLATLLGLLAILTLIISDLRFYLLPDVATATLLITFLTRIGLTYLYDYRLATPLRLIIIGTITGLIMAGLFFILDKLSLKFLKKSGLGFGDVKLIFVLCFGLVSVNNFNASILEIVWAITLMLLFACVNGLFFGVIKLFITKKNYLPFGPFLILGAILSAIFSGQLLTIF